MGKSRVSKPRKPAAARLSSPKSKSSPQAGTKAKSIKVRPGYGEKVVLLSGGNPQIAKADGDAPVQAYIAAMPGWKRGIGKRLHGLILRNRPNGRRAVKWNSRVYG